MKIIKSIYDKEQRRSFFVAEPSMKKVLGCLSDYMEVNGEYVDTLYYDTFFVRNRYHSVAEYIVDSIQQLLDAGYKMDQYAEKNFNYWKGRYAAELLEKEERLKAQKQRELELEKEKQERAEKYRAEKIQRLKATKNIEWRFGQRNGKIYVVQDGLALPADKEELSLLEEDEFIMCI